MRRSSMYSGRQSTVGMYLGGTGEKLAKDPRPIRDRNFQAECSRQILDYLLNNSYPHPVSPKTFTSPTTKEFTQIFQWLYLRIDPNYVFVKKFEDEVMSCLKALRYPFADQMARSAITAVGSQTSWPGMLGMLHWMTELIICGEKLMSGEIEIEDETNQSELLFFEYLTKAYQLFLAGSDDFTEAEKEMQQEFERRNEFALSEVERLSIEKDEVKGELEDLDETSPPLEALAKQKEVLLHDKSLMVDYIVHLESKKEKIKSLNSQMQKQLELNERELLELQNQVRDLQERVNAQPIPPSEVEKMTTERDNLLMSLDAVSKTVEEGRREVQEKEAILQTRFQDLDRLITRFNSLGYRVGIIPMTARYANKQDFELKLVRDIDVTQHVLMSSSSQIRPDQLVNRDLRNEIKPKLHKLRQTLGSQIHREQDEALKLQELLDRLSESLVDKREELEGIEARISSFMEQYQEAKETMQADYTGSRAEIERQEREINQMRIDAQNGLIALEQRMQSTSMEYEELVHAVDAHNDEFANEMAHFLESIAGVKLHVHSELAKFEEELEAAKVL